MQNDLCPICNKYGLPKIQGKDSCVTARCCIECGVIQEVTEEMKEKTEGRVK